MLDLFGRKKDDDPLETDPNMLLSDEQRESLEHDMALLDNTQEHRIQKAVEEEVHSAAENSAKRLNVIRMGRCPKCGEALSIHLAASICENCGWYHYARPKEGCIRIHLHGNDGVVEGKKGYVLKNGDVLVVNNDVVVAKIPAASYSRVEYVWTPEEITNLSKRTASYFQISCGWCGDDVDVNKDGFHLIHVAFGTTQERYCFCSDECYEAFRKTYPSRVHRNCYERNCADCNLCVKRYGDEAEGMRVLAKDFLRASKLNSNKK